jgi:hypothetical protein
VAINTRRFDVVLPRESSLNRRSENDRFTTQRLEDPLAGGARRAGHALDGFLGNLDFLQLVRAKGRHGEQEGRQQRKRPSLHPGPKLPAAHARLSRSFVHRTSHRSRNLSAASRRVSKPISGVNPARNRPTRRPKTRHGPDRLYAVTCLWFAGIGPDLGRFLRTPLSNYTYGVAREFAAGEIGTRAAPTEIFPPQAGIFSRFSRVRRDLAPLACLAQAACAATAARA